MIVLFFILWVIYAALEGYREAYLFHYQNIASPPNPKNLHPYFALGRGILLIIIFIYFWPNWELSASYTLLLSCIFPFIHDGMYYIVRDRLHPGTYPKGWKSESTMSNAKIELNFDERLLFLFIGISSLIAIEIFVNL